MKHYVDSPHILYQRFPTCGPQDKSGPPSLIK